MADPQQKSLEFPNFLRRTIPAWGSPGWMEAERWRRVVYNLPVAIDCRDALVNELVAADWAVKARDPKEEDAVADDIEHYTDVLNPDMGNAIVGFDMWVEKGAQDLLTIPVGWNNEIVRYPPGTGPLSRPHEKGHVYKVAYMDGATVYPTYDREFPLAQRLKGDVLNTIYFRRDEIARAVITPRPEFERWGFGMPPPEKIYLALTLIFRGDQYYANLLLDTPEAGLLDLLDMPKDKASEWVKSLRALFEGIDPFKIPVLYDHTKAAAWIPFGRPPTEMMFKDTYLHYAQISAAGYGLTLNDVGLGDPAKTLAGSIRDERRSRRSGFALVREKVKTLIDGEILPDYLEFVWQDQDEERQVQRGRAFMLAAQALKAAREARFISPLEGQQQLVKDGHITVEVEPPEEIEMPPIGGLFGGGNGNANREAGRVPPEQGGLGDVTTRAELGTRVAAVPADSPNLDRLATVFKTAFSDVLGKADRPRLLKLIKAATRGLFPDTAKAALALDDSELALWLVERAAFWIGEPSEFDEHPDVKKAGDDLLAELERILSADQWWAISEQIADDIGLIFQLSYEEGAKDAAQTAWELLYTEGLVDTPVLVGLNFALSNPVTLAELAEKSARLVRRVNDGTKFYLKRIITRGVEEGLASPNIAQMIRDGSDVEAVLKEAGYATRVIKSVQDEIADMSQARLNSIVNTEIAKAETDGRVGQWQHMGLTRKAWAHTGATGPNDPCPICDGNIALGFVPIDFLYESVFGVADTLGPPGHPGVCHCHVLFDENELMGKAGELEVWTGG